MSTSSDAGGEQDAVQSKRLLGHPSSTSDHQDAVTTRPSSVPLIRPSESDDTEDLTENLAQTHFNKEEPESTDKGSDQALPFRSKIVPQSPALSTSTTAQGGSSESEPIANVQANEKSSAFGETGVEWDEAEGAAQSGVASQQTDMLAPAPLKQQSDDTNHEDGAYNTSIELEAQGLQAEAQLESHPKRDNEGSDSSQAVATSRPLSVSEGAEQTQSRDELEPIDADTGTEYPNAQYTEVAPVSEAPDQSEDPQRVPTDALDVVGSVVGQDAETTKECTVEQDAGIPAEATSVETHTHQDTAPTLETSPVTSPSLPERQRSLPPPPLPSKLLQASAGESGDQSIDQERKAVARAFGVEDDPSVPTGMENDALHKSMPPTPSTAEKNVNAAQLPKKTTSAGLRIGKGPPPSTAPSEEKPFDFNRFLEQMKDPSAKGVGEYVRSFIRGFAKKPYRTADQMKLIFDFLNFISERMRQCSVWASLPEAEFENAREAMEKLVMNRLYNLTFTPAVAKEGRWTPQTDDLERDRVLAQRVELFGWLREEHLDVPMGDHSRGFIDFAMQELLKINHYKAPRDKLICILNCCKVIFGLIRHLGSDENADTFVPVLIFVVLKANPEHLISNVEYIGRFRDPSKLSSESGYYLSSLMGATAFIETMDYSSLSNITQEEFEKNVEAAVAKVGTRQPAKISASATLAPEPRSPPGKPGHYRAVSASDPHAPPSAGEEAARTLSGPTPAGVANFAEDTKAFLQRTGEAARVGLTNSLGKPIGALGKLLGEGLDGIRTPSSVAASASNPNSVGASPSRGNSPTPQQRSTHLQQERQQQPPQLQRRGVFSGLFGQDFGEQSSSKDEGVSGSFNPTSWSRSFRSTTTYDDEEPQTPATTEGRQGPFSSLVRNPDYSNVPPARKIGEVPFAPPHRPLQQQAAGRKLPPPQRMDSLDPFNSPEPSVAAADYSFSSARLTFAGPQAANALRRGSEYSEGIGTPSEGGSEDDDDRFSSQVGRLQASERKLPDLGAFVPSFLTETPAPANQYGASGGYESQLRRGPNQGRAALPGHSSLAPSSEGLGYTDSTADTSTGDGSEDLAGLSADVERVHSEQLQAAVETLRSVFPDTDDEVRRMVLEACDGDVATAIDRLLEMQSGA